MKIPRSLLAGPASASLLVALLFSGPFARGQAVHPLVAATNSPGITVIYRSTFFSVPASMTPKYAGAQACSECHQAIHTTEMSTRHANAFKALKDAHQDTNPSCLPCHTVGYGLPSGFVSESATPQLAGVQCESCHGPAARHMANEFNPQTRPLVEAAGTMCGGCHTGTHGEWSTSGHAEVVENLNPLSRISTCGRCHSGSVRVSLLKQRSLPVGKANVPLGCPACHDPHANHVWTNVLTGVRYSNQLRSPVSSTNDYSLSTTDTFGKKYNPNVNICGQCHNRRGATWTISSQPPHNSPQYNMLLGSVGELDSGPAKYAPASHGLLITNQCAGCHMQIAPPDQTQPPIHASHTFSIPSADDAASLQVCQNCHFVPNILLRVVSTAVSNQVNDIKLGLDFWATNNAPANLKAKYGTRAWEYTMPGELSPGGPGPTATEQKQIPVNIQKARFNLYLVLHDGSYGIHNPGHIADLLDAAQNWVEDEVKK